VQAFARKMPPRGETVIEGETGEEHHAGQGANYFLYSTRQITNTNLYKLLKAAIRVVDKFLFNTPKYV